jgi:hypothetical protein
MEVAGFSERLLPTKLYGSIPQKIITFILASVSTSHVTNLYFERFLVRTAAPLNVGTCVCYLNGGLLTAEREMGLEDNYLPICISIYGSTVPLSHLGHFFSFLIIYTVRCFENLAQFKYFGMTVTNQNLIQD